MLSWWREHQVGGAAHPGIGCGAALRERQVSCRFRSLEDSKHAYYLVFDFEIEVTDKFGSTTARADLELNLCPGAAPNLHDASPKKSTQDRCRWF